MIKTALEQGARRQGRKKERFVQLTGAGLSNVGMVVLMLVFTRAAPLNAGAPFAVALMASALFARKPVAPLIVGCALGCAWEQGALAAASPLIGCALTFAGFLLMKRISFFRADEGGPTRMKDLGAAALAGASMLLASLPFLMDMPYDGIAALVNAALALAAAPTMSASLTMNPKRTRLLREEQISLALMCACALVGLRLSPLVGQSLAHLLAALMTLLCATCSVGAGAACGVLTGSVLTLMGDTPYVGVALALCGLLAGAVKPLGRPAMALAFALGNCISLIYTAGQQAFVINPYIALFAGVLLCFVPPAAEKKLHGWFSSVALPIDSELMAAHVRMDAHQRVRALGLLFQEMSLGYETPSALPDEQALVMQMRARLCEGCRDYEHCWGGSNSRAGRLLVELLGDALCGRLIDASASELPPDISRKCRRAAQIPKKLGPMLSEFDEKRRAAKERGECKALLASQFRQASDALLSEGDRLASPMRLDRELIDRTCAALDREGLEADGVWVVEDDLPKLFIGLKGRYWNRSAAQKAARGLTSSLGVPMKSAMAAGGVEADELCFAPAPRMSVDVGFAGRAGLSGKISGDSHLTGALSDGRVLLALSDGMGSGARAQGESATALRLLRRFLGSGVPLSMALSAINELLLLRSGDEMFATADLCLLDLTACRAEFSKLGSCASLILRRDRVIRIEGGQLPMGVLNKVTPIEANVRLQVGDLIVMVTDGVLDSAREGQIEWLESMVRRYRNEPPQKLCERLVSLAAARPKSRKDDMTALVARVGDAGATHQK